jgi:hypothetical protein
VHVREHARGREADCRQFFDTLGTFVTVLAIKLYRLRLDPSGFLSYQFLGTFAPRLATTGVELLRCAIIGDGGRFLLVLRGGGGPVDRDGQPRLEAVGRIRPDPERAAEAQPPITDTGGALEPFSFPCST